MDRKAFKRGALVGVLAMCVIFVIFLAGSRLINKLYAKSHGTEGAEEASDVIGNDTKDKLGLLSALIDHYYLYEDEIDEQKLEEGIYAGYVSYLGDPYSYYYDKDATKELQESTSGEYSGIGAVLQVDKTSGLVRIVNVYKDSPAEKAGLRKDDLIEKVNDKDVAGVDLSEVVTWIRGEKGTEVTITVAREGEEGKYDELDLTAVRSNIEVETVYYEMLDGKVGYIAVSEFDDVTYEQFKEALNTLDEKGAKGMVVDLRDNPGGNLDIVCDMLDLMLPEGTVVYTKDKNDKREDYTSDEAHQYNKPVSVLVNGSSASASEIFAGAMRDFKAAKIVGTTTYGKGVVQQIIDLKDGTCVKLTVAEYFTPSGDNINKKGITPDAEVEPGEDDVFGNPKTDKQLRKAIEELK